MQLIYLSTSRLHRDRANVIQTLHTVDALGRAGVDCRLLMPPWHGGEQLVRRRQRELGLETLDIQARQSLHSRWPRFLFAALHRAELARADAVYARSLELSQVLCRFRIIHHLEVHTLSGIGEGPLRSLCAAHREGLIGWLFPISRSAAQPYLDAGADERRLQVAPSGVAIEWFADMTPFDAVRERPMAVYLGTVSRTRGLDVLESLAQSGAADVLVVGRLEKERFAPQSCRYHKPVPHRQVIEYYGQADVLLLPYQPDLPHADAISPIKLFEAMAAGRPIIASDLPPIREVLQDAENALLVPPNDHHAWARALERLRQDPSLARRLAAQARAQAAGYSWSERAATILTALRSGRG